MAGQWLGSGEGAGELSVSLQMEMVSGLWSKGPRLLSRGLCCPCTGTLSGCRGSSRRSTVFSDCPPAAPLGVTRALGDNGSQPRPSPAAVPGGSGLPARAPAPALHGDG